MIKIYICPMCRAEHTYDVLYCRVCGEYTSASGCFESKEVEDEYDLYDGDMVD